MTLGKAIIGLQIVKNGTYEIGFNGCEKIRLSADDMMDLLVQWFYFRIDNKIAADSVNYVEQVATNQDKTI